MALVELLLRTTRTTKFSYWWSVHLVQRFFVV